MLSFLDGNPDVNHKSKTSNKYVKSKEKVLEHITKERQLTMSEGSERRQEQRATKTTIK